MPCTRHIGADGSGAFVEFLSDGKDSSGRSWCGTPDYMLSYSWSYTMSMLIAGLRSFEREHPPSRGECHYYFIE